jgi:predicted SprT family Zn-dependent metalloprotease
MKYSTAKRICKKLSCQYGIVKSPDVIPLKYSRTGKSVILGYYNNQENLIEINKYVMKLWTANQIREVIQHELIHARCYQDFGHGGHGKRFQLLAEIMGISKEVRTATKTRE